MILPRITFGIIVLNGEPFTRYNLRALYPFAHQIIVVEGAAPAAVGVATADGHSRDGTLEILRRLKQEEDPAGKILIVTAEDDGHPNGFWPGEKDEQSQAYARRATGDYLWQVDADEFYRPEDMARVCALLRDRPGIAGASFRQITFWGGLDYVADGWFLRRYLPAIHRLFKWGPGYRYTTHRPPTVIDDQGRDLRRLDWRSADDMQGLGVRLYHYSLLLPKQVEEKCAYYATAPLFARQAAMDWYEQVFLKLQRPFRTHNVYQHPSWLERYRGDHPPEIMSMYADLKAGKLPISLRRTDDIEELLASPYYRIGRSLLILGEPTVRWWSTILWASRAAPYIAQRVLSAGTRLWRSRRT